MRFPAAFAAMPLILLAGCAKPAAPAVQAADAFCRPVIAERDVTGCYVTLTASQADRLIKVETDAAREVQMHAMSMDGGIMRMWEMKDGLPLPAGEAVALKPGGNHLMVMGLKAPLRAGDNLVLRLTFDKAAPVEVTAMAGTGPQSAAATPEMSMAPSAHEGHEGH